MEPHEYAFETSHIVADTVGEPENLIFDMHDQTPEFKRAMGILSNKFGILRFELEPGPSSARKDDSEPKDVERQFRKMPTEITEVLQISN